MKFLPNLFIVFCFTFFNAFSQIEEEKFYQITYELELRSLPTDKNSISKDLNTERLLNDLKKVISKIQFELIFNSERSIFKQKDYSLSEKERLLYDIASSGVEEEVFYYRNNQEKFVLRQDLGKNYKVVFPLDQYKWTTTKETKTINGFKCYKAYANWSEYDYKRKKLLKFKPVVWYASGVPFSYGPKGLDGLPGLVLEGSLNGVLFFKIKKSVSNDFVLSSYPEEFPILFDSHSKKIKYKDYLKLLKDYNN